MGTNPFWSSKTVWTTVLWSLCATGTAAFSQTGNLDSFGHVASPTTPAFSAAAPVEPFGPVPTDGVSLINAAPVLLPYFNNGPVYGIPGTVLGSFWDRTQLTGDWGGRRTDLARRGLFFDVYSTSVWQDVGSGGLQTGSAFVDNIQMSINLDTARAGLWEGGLIHFTTQSRYGGSPENTFTAGASAPQYTGLVLPDPLASSSTLPSEYFLVQALSEKNVCACRQD